MIILAHELKAVSTIASTNYAREILTGIAIYGDTESLTSSMDYTLVSTDSYRLVKITKGKPDETYPLAVISASIGKAIKASDKTVEVLPGMDDTYVKCIIRDKKGIGRIEQCELVRGTFPNWKQLMPEYLSCETSAHNPKLMESMYKAFRTACGDNAVRITTQCLKPALLEAHTKDFSSEMTGLLMPVRIA